MSKSNVKEKLEPHVKYASYVLRHKWYVFREARKLGVPWLGVIHDWSKFLPSEWFPYVENFYGKGTKPKQEVDAAFDMAWLKHIHRHHHHWQYFLLQEDDGGTKTLDMPEKYIREMVSDWKGAAKAQGFDEMMPWFDKNHHKHKLSYKTRFVLYELLERYDLLAALIVEKLKSEMPHTILEVGLGKKRLLLSIEDLRYEEQCERWFEDMQSLGFLPDDYLCLICEKHQPQPKMLAYKKVLS